MQTESSDGLAAASLAPTLLAILHKAARQNSIAIEWQPSDGHGAASSNRTISYASLLHRTATIQEVLRQHSICCGDRVGLHLYRQPDMIATMLACLLSGVTFVPLEPSFPAERLATIEQEAALKAILQQPSLATSASFSCRVIELGDPNGIWSSHEPVLQETALQKIALQEIAQAPVVADGLPDDLPAYIMFTSGSTGKPKGVVIDHQALATFLQASTGRLGMSNSTRWLQITTMAFDISMLEIFGPLWVGGCGVLVTSEEYRDPHAICRYLGAEQGINVLQATPTFWRMLLNTPWQGSDQLVALCGGEALDLSLARRLVTCTQQVWNCYGPTEATVWSLMAEITPESVQQPTVLLQHSLAGYTHQVVGADLHPVAIGEEGELCIQGDALSQGYWQRDDLTAKQFVTLPNQSVRSYRTGDSVRLIGPDCYQYLGRLDDQVKLRGFRIELGEVEAQLKSLDGVNDAAVKLIGEGEEAQLVAFMEAGKALPSKLVMRKALLKSLPNYMVPNRFVIVDVLPKTASGKVDRKQLHV